jgi:hypothetical protein
LFCLAHDVRAPSQRADRAVMGDKLNRVSNPPNRLSALGREIAGSKSGSLDRFLQHGVMERRSQVPADLI